jgi:multicomponent K+:H+ antiporter subunit E
MKRLLPSPLLSLCLFVAWLMLNESVSTGHLLLATLLAVGLPLLTDRLRPDKPALRAPATILRLGAVVLKDIQPRFVWVPLDIRSAHGIVMLAGIITMTPGTLSAELSDDRRHLLVHAFNVDDEAALVADIKARYESPLREIFE